jgi:hypothetical protein
MATLGGAGKMRVIACQWELPAGIAMVTRGGRGRVKWKVPDRHVVAALWPNNSTKIYTV